MNAQPITEPTFKTQSKGQYRLEENVEYKIINTLLLIDRLQENGVKLSKKAIESRSLLLIKQEALKVLTFEEVETLTDSCARQVFSENKLGKLLLKGFRLFASDPIDSKGQVKDGIFNNLAAYGLRISGLTGSWGGSRNIKNLVTNAGFAGVASRINGAGSEAAFTYIAVGTGTTAANAADTTLETELATSGLSRASASASRVTTTQTNDTAQLVNTFNVTGSQAVTESGVLNAASNGVLLCRQVFSAINVVNGDSLQITWKIKAA